MTEQSTVYAWSAYGSQPTFQQCTAVRREIISDTFKQSAKSIGEPVKGRVKRELCVALGHHLRAPGQGSEDSMRGCVQEVRRADNISQMSSRAALRLANGLHYKCRHGHRPSAQLLLRWQRTGDLSQDE